MYIAKIPNRNSAPAYLLRESFREDGKVKNRTLANLSCLPLEQIEQLRLVLKGQKLVPAEEAFEILRSLPHGNVTAVLGTLRKIGLDKIIAPGPCRQRDLVVAMIVARILQPRSKLATTRSLSQETRTSTLADLLGLGAVDENDLYEAMDWLLQRQHRIEKKLARRHLQDGSLVLYDLSSSYYTGTHCPLVAFGHNRDGKKRFPQIVYGLLCNRDGCPVAVEVFEGNTADPKTLSVQIDKLRKHFGLKRVVIVGDRGMLTTARIREEMAGVEGLDWITALRSPAIRKLVNQGDISQSLFDEQDLAEVTSSEYPGERLVVCRNPLLADERARKREALLRATEVSLQKIVAATQRKRRPLRGKDKIGLRVGKVLDRRKVGKHFVLEIEDERFSFSRNEVKIVEEAALDGMYVIRSSVPAEEMTAEQTVSSYKGLSVVERAFRSLKTVDLKVRPIFHRLPNRVRAHVLLCVLAYYVEWHMRGELASILFDDDDREQANAMRESVVAPAERSERAHRKDSTKRTDDGLPVHSFQTMLDDLATLTRNRVRTDQAEFDMLAQTTEYQARVFELLSLKP